MALNSQVEPLAPDSAAMTSLAIWSHPSRMKRLILAAIVCVYILLASLYAIRVTPFNAPDEPAHFNYVRDIARGHFPILTVGDWDAALLERLKSIRFPPGSDISTIRYESHQPPLYYLLVAPAAAVTAGLSEHDQVRAVRLASIVIGAGALLAIYGLASELFPDNPILGLLAVGIAAAIPMRIAVTASVSNDGLAELVMTLVLWRSVRMIRRGVTGRRLCFLGVLVGLGLLTKMTLVIAVPVACLAILFATGIFGPGVGRLTRTFFAVRSLLITGGCAALVVLPWWLRGAMAYGWTDPLGLRRHDEVVTGQQLTGLIDLDLAKSLLVTLFRSFWGQFGWMGVILDERIYLIFTAATAAFIVTAGLWLLPPGGSWKWRDSAIRAGLILLMVSFTGIFLGMVGYNLTYLQPQGRYLFPAMAAITILSAGGIQAAIPDSFRVYALALIGLLMVGLDVQILFRVVEPALRY